MSNQVESISLLEDNSNVVLKLNAVSDTILNSNWAKVKIDSNGWDKAFSCFTSSFLNTDKQPLLTGGLYKATGNVKNYMTYKDGRTASIEMKNGKIHKHSGFEKINGSMVFMGMMGVQIIASFLQSYFDNTDEKLNIIFEKLEFLTNSVSQKEKSEIESAKNTLKYLLSSKSFTLEDFNTIQRVIEKTYKSRDFSYNTYIKETEQLKSKIEDTSNVTYHKMAKTIKEKVESNQFIEYLKIVVQADELYHIARMTDLYMNLRYENPDVNRINKIQEKINTLLDTDYNEFQEKIKASYNSVKSITQNKIAHFERRANIYVSVIKEVKKDLDEKFTNFDMHINQSSKLTKDRYHSLSKSFSEQQDFLIDNRAGKPILYLKNA